MATRNVTVTVTMNDLEWRLVEEAADCAGMTVQAYIGWSTRLLAQQARPTGAGRARPAQPRCRRAPAVVDAPGEQAWADSFTERLSHRAAFYRDN